jgi:hypothetical protein
LPPPQPVPQPVPAPYYPPPAKGGKGLWILLIILAFAAGVGGTILTLWLTGDLWNSRSNYYPSGYGSGTGSSPGSSTTTGTTGSTGYTAPAPTPVPAPSVGVSTRPTASTLVGSWGRACPGSGNELITFYADGTASSDGENGTWSLDGSYVNLNNGRQNLSLYWEMLGNDSARVRRSGAAETRMVYRCS